MKKLILSFLWLALITGSAYAMGGVLPAKPTINDVLIQDNTAWSGLTYNGSPIKGGTEAIGQNRNYIYQITTIDFNNGTLRVQIYLKDLAPSAYSIAMSQLTNKSNVLGYTAYAFEDSGIVMPRNWYYGVMNTATTSDWTWQIIVSYDVPKDKVAQFKTDVANWAQGKLPQVMKRTTNTFYYK